jgi:elongation factor Ts
VAKSDQFKALARSSPPLVAAKGDGAPSARTRTAIDDLKITLKENIDLGQVVRIEAAPGNVIDTYLHRRTAAA